MTLKDRLSDWTDWDGAEFEVAIILGLVEDSPESFIKNKALFWTASLKGSALGNILQELVKAGILEHRSEPDQQYRWNSHEQQEGETMRRQPISKPPPTPMPSHGRGICTSCRRGYDASHALQTVCLECSRQPTGK